MTTNLDTLDREELLTLWCELNDALGECCPEDYDFIFDDRSAVEDALDALR